MLRPLFHYSRCEGVKRGQKTNPVLANSLHFAWANIEELRLVNVMLQKNRYSFRQIAIYEHAKLAMQSAALVFGPSFKLARSLLKFGGMKDFESIFLLKPSQA